MRMRARSRATPSSVIDGPSDTRASLPRTAGVVYRIRVGLAELLVSHPFADDERLLHTPDCSVTAGEARRAAAATAAQLRDADVEPRPPAAVAVHDTTAPG